MRLATSQPPIWRKQINAVKAQFRDIPDLASAECHCQLRDSNIQREVSHMKKSLLPFISLSLLLPTLTASAAEAKECSTEKVNHEDCTVLIDRRYPITLPTIQMSRGKKVIVLIQEPLPFETLTLDETSATALQATDQAAALVTAAIPDLKGFFWSSATSLPPSTFTPHLLEEVIAEGVNPCDPGPGYDREKCDEVKRLDVVNNELAVLKSMLDAAQASLPDSTSSLFNHVTIIYAQLNQVMSPIPRPDPAHVPSPLAPGTPDPWKDYSRWRAWMLCELVGGKVDGNDCKIDTNTVPPHPTDPTFNNVLGDIGTLQTRLPSTPPASPPDNPLFDQKTFDALVKQTKSDIDKLTIDEDKKKAIATLKALQSQENSLTSAIAALASTLTSVQKDFLTYYQNIYLAKDTLSPRKIDNDGKPLPRWTPLGAISDPLTIQPNNRPVAYKIFGRQVVFSVNAVNQISTSLAAVTATSAKVSVATITVLYADPRLEASAGAMFSFVHNRSFVNQTVTTPPPGSSLMPGDIVIYETKTDPEVVPFVAANWRVFNDFAPTWLAHRRSAVYATVWLGLNPYTTLPEYGIGPSISWRSLMFSAVYNRAHQVVLTSGSYVNQVVCSPTALAGATPPPCTPAPPAPTTRTNPTNAFAIGISVRVPTIFTAGGVSH